VFELSKDDLQSTRNLPSSMTDAEKFSLISLALKGDLLRAELAALEAALDVLLQSKGT
jgi:hypothetical protein